MTAAQELVAFAASLKLEDISARVVAAAKDHLLDTIGVALAGRGTDGDASVMGLVGELGGAGKTSAWGGPKGVTTAAAAFVNGTRAHALDYDDSHATTVLHPGAVLAPALVAQAEASGSSGAELLACLVAAYEVELRLGMAQHDSVLGNSVFFERGFHATSILGAVAAAPLVARLRGLDEAAMLNAMAIAASFGSGILEANRSGGTVKQVHCGWAAHAAVCAAGLAAHGLTGPDSVLEGKFGLLSDFCSDRWSSSALTDGLGETWLGPDVGIKPYPCNMFAHTTIEAAIELKREGMAVEDVAEVRIGTAAPAARTIGEPIELKRAPNTAYQAAFSAPYLFASALAGGDGLGIGLLDFSEAALTDEARRSLAARCWVDADRHCTAVFPAHMSVVVEVSLVGGGSITKRVDDARGSRYRPLTDEEMEIKLRGTARDSAWRLQSAVGRLESSERVEELVEAMS